MYPRASSSRALPAGLDASILLTSSKIEAERDTLSIYSLRLKKVIGGVVGVHY
jgi:hypothetical protein